MEGQTQEIMVYSCSPELNHGLSLPVKAVNHRESLLSFMTNTSYSLLLADDQLNIEDLGKMTETYANRVGVIYITDLKEKELLKPILSHPAVLSVLNRSEVKDVLSDHVESGKTDLARRQHTENILEKVRSQNKTLQELNDNLESIVEKRTSHIKLSADELADNNRSIRLLTKFVKSLSLAEEMDDLMLLLRQELGRFHKLRAPIFIYSLDQNNYRCSYFQGQQLIDTSIDIPIHAVGTQNQEQVRLSLAGQLGRPISAVLSLYISGFDSLGVFIFEHSMDAIEQAVFEDFLDRRAKSLQVAFEQLALKIRYRDLSRQWSVTFDSLDDPIAIIDRSSKVVRSNKIYRQHMGESCYKVFAGRDKICVGCPVPNIDVQTSSRKGTVSIGDKIFEVSAYPIVLNGDGEFSNMIVHYTDSTKAVGLQSQLIQSEKMAAIGLLAGNIAHELNNPLTGIKSLAQLLLMEIEKESELFSDLQEVEHAAYRCEQIIKNLLEFSSFQGSQHRVVNVKEVILKTLPFLKTAMRFHNSHIDLDEQDWQVQVEPHLLQQVIFNLVNNACQAMGDTGDLYLKTRLSSVNKGVEIVIKDTGPGIPEKIRDAIFTPFFTTKEEGKGTGLGLSMSRSVIEKFNGELRLVSTGATGSEFVIWLPLYEKTGG